MADRLEFKEKLAGILALAEGQNGKITVDEVEKYFEEDGLSQEQMNLVCDYLLSMKMAVVGYKQTGATKRLTHRVGPVRGIRSTQSTDWSDENGDHDQFGCDDGEAEDRPDGAFR